MIGHLNERRYNLKFKIKEEEVKKVDNKLRCLMDGKYIVELNKLIS